MHLDHRDVVLVRGELKVRMHAYFGDGEIYGTALSGNREVVFAESHDNVAGLEAANEKRRKGKSLASLTMRLRRELARCDSLPVHAMRGS